MPTKWLLRIDKSVTEILLSLFKSPIISSPIGSFSCSFLDSSTVHSTGFLTGFFYSVSHYKLLLNTKCYSNKNNYNK